MESLIGLNTSEDPTHPFYPLDSLIVGYVANTMHFGAILGIFAAAVTVICTTTHIMTKRLNPNISNRDRNLTMWFVICGAIHLLVEGYFSINHKHMPQMEDYLGQGWKEYSKSDSRYMTAEAFVVCMESVTAWAWGPLSLVTAWMIMTDSPWRHPTQALVSSGQFYGLILYFMTNSLELSYRGVSYSRPEAYYWWSYYILLNAPWLIIPPYCTYTSALATVEAFVKVKQFGIQTKAAVNSKK